MSNNYCEDYCGINCISNCPIIINNEYPDIYEKSVSSCKECLYYKGCDDCYFSNTEYCDKTIEKESNNENNM